MATDHGAPEVDTARAKAVFRGLADTTRIAILIALAEHHRTERGALTFSELRRRAEVADSGRFNYHLDELVPRFVERTDDGYRLRYAGRQAYGLLVAGTGSTESVDLGLETDHTCMLCGAQLVAHYEHDILQLRCPDHGGVAGTGLPPRVVADRPLDELLEVVDAEMRSQVEFARREFCPECWSSMETSIDMPAVEVPQDVDDPPIIVHHRCRTCSYEILVPLRFLLASHPAVVDFHLDHDHAITDVPFLRLDEHLAATDTSVDGELASVTFEAGDDTLTVAVDDAGVVRSVDRQS